MLNTDEYFTERYQSQSVQNPANMTKAMASTASTPSVISSVRTRRDGRPTLIRGPVGPPPRSGIWKANVRPSSSRLCKRCFGCRPMRPAPLLRAHAIVGPTHATY
ncbi:hypothetical protein SSP531S_19640 [Streptomyces spongiicola]|uniref:Uncharacterized protein n=1 Tax=Streptomyces spongiicola TaxID=1690221 RepID=A0A388SV87_9ACTN|nr:hypothetical protein SSP531S_19640 [Streptomyces spongiicola]